MDPDQPVCLCFKVSQRKLVNFLNREKPEVPSQLSDCLGAGTGCQWCVPSLCALHAEWKAGKEPDLAVDATEYAEQRKQFRATGKRPD